MKILLFHLFLLFSFFCYAQDKTNDITILQNKITQFEKSGDTLNQNYLISLNNLALLYEEQNKFKDSELLFLRVLEIKKKISGVKTTSYAITLYNLAGLYIAQDKYTDAELLYLKVIEIRKEILGVNNLSYAKALISLATLYSNQQKYSEAEILYLDVLKIRKKILGENHDDYIIALKILANLYIKVGNYKEAEPLYLELIEIRKKKLGVNHPDYVNSLNNLGVLYYYEGKYKDAETLYLEVLKIRKEILGINHPDYAISLNNLAELYRTQNKNSDAEHLYLEALEIQKNNFGGKSKNYLIALSNLALLNTSEGKYVEAESKLKEVLEINKEIFGEDSINYATSLGNLAALNSYANDLNRYSETETQLLKVLGLRKKFLGENNPEYSLTLRNLASFYEINKEFSRAESFYLKALEIREKSLGVNHPEYISNLFDLATFYRKIEINSKSSNYFEQFSKANKNRMDYDIYSLTESELISYINFRKEILFSLLSFLNNFPYQYPEINSSSFDTELLIKNLSIRNQEQIKKAILKSNNRFLKVKYEQFISNKRQLTKLSELPLDKQSSNLTKLKDETEQLEKELSKESVSFSDFKKSISVTFDQIKDKLKNNEVSINVVSYNYYSKRATDSIVYSAFVVGKDFKFPKFIPLFEEKQLVFLLGRNKRQQDSTRIDKQYQDKAISDLFFKPLEKELKGISTVYLSASGLGHQIDFAALPINDNQTLGEKFKLHILSSPAEIMDYKATGLDNKNNLELLLYGGIDYDKTNSVAKAGTDIAENNETLKELQTRSGISEFGYLAGSKKEVMAIHEKGIENGFKATILDDRNATEESIKQLDGRTSPFVLHLATHGFFFPDPEQETPAAFNLETEKKKIYKASDDPMMRSGLVFAGANKNWSKPNENTTTEDGILTASEISNLDLSACQLVILSACETGLGEVKGSEGVFGLQRAFKMAGVKNIIMSLWKVPDAQTAELFEIFYGECFAGKTIHEAFQTAQAKMKAKYSPYYWAGFVLLE